MKKKKEELKDFEKSAIEQLYKGARLGSLR
jgi:hypothetical protein